MELSKHVWNLKEEHQQFSIRWAIIKQIPAGRNGEQNSTLCLEGKLMIMKVVQRTLLIDASKCLVNVFMQCNTIILDVTFVYNYVLIINLTCQLLEDRQLARNSE